MLFSKFQARIMDGLCLRSFQVRSGISYIIMKTMTQSLRTYGMLTIDTYGFFTIRSMIDSS